MTADVYTNCFEQWDVLSQALRDARYQIEGWGPDQKLLLADIDMLSQDEVEARDLSGDPLWSKFNTAYFKF